MGYPYELTLRKDTRPGSDRRLEGHWEPSRTRRSYILVGDRQSNWIGNRMPWVVGLPSGWRDCLDKSKPALQSDPHWLDWTLAQPLERALSRRHQRRRTTQAHFWWPAWYIRLQKWCWHHSLWSSRDLEKARRALPNDRSNSWKDQTPGQKTWDLR